MVLGTGIDCIGLILGGVRQSLALVRLETFAKRKRSPAKDKRIVRCPLNYGPPEEVSRKDEEKAWKRYEKEGFKNKVGKTIQGTDRAVLNAFSEALGGRFAGSLKSDEALEHSANLKRYPKASGTRADAWTYTSLFPL